MATSRFVRLRLAGAGMAAVLAVTMVPGSASAAGPVTPGAGTVPMPGGASVPGVGAVPAAPAGPGLAALPASPPPSPAGMDRAKLSATLDATHAAGMYGLVSAVRDGKRQWDGASGVADVRSGRPVKPGMEQRIGSITKSFVATAVMQQVERGRLGLDEPIGTYLPELFPGELGRQVTVRMVLNHTSGIGDYVSIAFPSLAELSPSSLDEGRHRRLRPEQLVNWGLSLPRTGTPGERWSYSNTNYVIAGLLLEKATGGKAETYIAREVIGKAGLKHTYFPKGARLDGPHSKMYESLYQHVKPPRDYSTYDMSWAWTAGALVSTMDDLNRFYRTLLTGGLTSKASLAEMQKTVPVKDAEGNVTMNYGLGIYALDLPCGRFWGHDGAVFGAGTQSLSSADGRRQVSVSLNLMKYQQLNGEGAPMPHPVDNALSAHLVQALCGGEGATTKSGGETPVQPLPLQFRAFRP
ncbi:serine hydrolase domain-containing protein [Spirillospora sp. NBC_01491]|uniref:serine hydrolase domain-containing protein n=1 Tax=Spirillospora sp. NBC_01491 TaxID=2976007 RepID=UPI002E382002|nr:serine hydrolase domain-containing protein [Spirillospora sp. NBC_01491]